ncbi:hypothetical protein ACROAE_15885 [Shewanella sp. MF05960]|uniref:hypothetical protein n=1 Tax=Shewanella sp. MF05960 TaxID=3434874 RepID=UPI003D7BE203
MSHFKTGEDRLYLAVVIDMYSRRIVSLRMTRSLVDKAFLKTCNLRKPPKGLVFHSGRGYLHLLKQLNCQSSIGECVWEQHCCGASR